MIIMNFMTEIFHLFLIAYFEYSKWIVPRFYLNSNSSQANIYNFWRDFRSYGRFRFFGNKVRWALSLFEYYNKSPIDHLYRFIFVLKYSWKWPRMSFCPFLWLKRKALSKNYSAFKIWWDDVHIGLFRIEIFDMKWH